MKPRFHFNILTIDLLKRINYYCPQIKPRIMKTFIVLFSAMLLYNLSISQNLLLNGSFESNAAIGNTFGLSTNWAATVSDSWEIDAGIMSLITSNNCGTASDGNWYVTNCPGCSI